MSVGLVRSIAKGYHSRCWRRRDDGVVAVEFALLAMPFFILIVGLIEICLFFAAGVVLEGGANEAGRLIRTGQAQLSGDPEAAFSGELCGHVSSMLDCDNLQYEVIHIGSGNFAGAENNEPVFDDEGNLVSQGFNAGNSNDVIMVRTVYRYEFLTPFLGAMMTGDAGRNWMIHAATVVIKSEPYVFGEE